MRISFSFFLLTSFNAGTQYCEMLSDVHKGLLLPVQVVDSAVVRGKYEFYHYEIDGVDDRVSIKSQFAEKV